MHTLHGILSVVMMYVSHAQGNVSTSHSTNGTSDTQTDPSMNGMNDPSISSTNGTSMNGTSNTVHDTYVPFNPSHTIQSIHTIISDMHLSRQAYTQRMAVVAQHMTVRYMQRLLSDIQTVIARQIGTDVGRMDVHGMLYHITEHIRRNVKDVMEMKMRRKMKNDDNEDIKKDENEVKKDEKEVKKDMNDDIKKDDMNINNDNDTDMNIRIQSPAVNDIVERLHEMVRMIEQDIAQAVGSTRDEMCSGTVHMFMDMIENDEMVYVRRLKEIVNMMKEQLRHLYVRLVRIGDTDKDADTDKDTDKDSDKYTVGGTDSDSDAYTDIASPISPCDTHAENVIPYHGSAGIAV